MIQTVPFVRRSRLLTAVEAAFIAAGSLLLVPAQGWAGEKGRQAKLQKILDARAMQMQVDGTVGTNCSSIATRGESKEISIKEARTMLLTGRYSTSECIVYGSKPELFYKGLNGLIFYRAATRKNVKIEVSDHSFYGSTFTATAPMRKNTDWNGSTYTTQPGFSSKKYVSARAYFVGTKTIVTVLNPAQINEKDTRADCQNDYLQYMKSKKTLEDDRKITQVRNFSIKPPADFPTLSSICFKYYPSTIDENMETTRLYAESLLVDR